MRTRLGFVVIIAAFLFPSHLSAADASKNAVSFSFASSDNSIAYRRSFGMFAGLISAGYSSFSFDSSDSQGNHQKESDHAWTLGVGLRRYIAAKTPVHPFIQLDVSRSVPGTGGVAVGASCDASHFNSGTFTGGAEYHFTPSISIEARAGISATKSSERCSSTDLTFREDVRTLNTFRSAVALNFYF
jgi:hypothetical protein